MVAEVEADDSGHDDSVEHPPSPRAARYGHLVVALVVVLVDQLTKAWALSRLDDDIIELPLDAQLRLVRNPGFAFSQGRSLGPLIAIVAAVVVIVLWRMGRSFRSRASIVGLGLVLGGAAGNLIDRIFRSGDGFLGGEVIDFVDLGWWPVFNVADAAIVVGAGLLAILAIRQPSP